MAEKESPVPAVANGGIPNIQTLNVVPQKVIQVNKPTGYYRDREKIKIFIYQICLY